MVSGVFFFGVLLAETNDTEDEEVTFSLRVKELAGVEKPGHDTSDLLLSLPPLLSKSCITFFFVEILGDATGPTPL